MKYLKHFRLTFVVFTFAFMVVLGKSSLDSYESLNSVVMNKTNERWYFGFNSIVMGGEKKEVLFKGNHHPQAIESGETYPMGRDASRDRIVGVYLEGNNKQLEISCPQGFVYYSVEIRDDAARCHGTNNKISRWIANAPYTPYFMGFYLSVARELLVGEV